jgi:gas vesicle protein
MISTKDIIESMADARENRFLMGMLLGIGVGAIAGGAAALLLSPRSGPELRQLISERSSDLVDKAKHRLGAGGAGKTTEG